MVFEPGFWRKADGPPEGWERRRGLPGLLFPPGVLCWSCGLAPLQAVLPRATCPLLPLSYTTDVSNMLLNGVNLGRSLALGQACP